MSAPGPIQSVLPLQIGGPRCVGSVDAKKTGSDPFAAIEGAMPWEAFSDSDSVTEAKKLAQPEDFDYLVLIGNGFNSLRRYTLMFLNALDMKAAPPRAGGLE